MNHNSYQGKNLAFVSDILLQEELAFIFDKVYDRDKNKFNELMDQFLHAIKSLDQNWKANSKPLTKPKLSTYKYRTLKFFSSKSLQRIPYNTPDFRIIFKYNEQKNEIYLLSVGIRVDPYNNTYLPKEHDIYNRMNQVILPEDN